MDKLQIGVLSILVVMLLIQSGMHIAIALMMTSFAGVWLLRDYSTAGKLLASSATTSIANDVFAVIPLFVLMGLVVSATGMGRDIFDVTARFTQKRKGGLPIATVLANAVFAACTGTSIASASVFTKVAAPEMIRHGYTPAFSLGVVAGSSVLGMLIPPSLLMIIFGIVANVSIGDLFLSGVIPGLLLSGYFIFSILICIFFFPKFVFSNGVGKADLSSKEMGIESWHQSLLKVVPIGLLVASVVGGLYFGFFTPTEAGAAGALTAIVLGLFRRELGWVDFWELLLETGRVTCAICFILMSASIYSQMLTMSGLPYAVSQWLVQSNFNFGWLLFLYLVAVLILGCFLDSLSIMLILLPFVIPLFDGFGTNLVWFGIVTIVAIEIGLLTPPLGMSVFVVKASVKEIAISTWGIFKGTFPMTLAMSLFLLHIVVFPYLSIALLNSSSWSWW
jgi:tripartite ATP-independent transporter DctM subunit